MDLIPLLAASFLRWNFEFLARLTIGGNHMSLFKDLFKRADSGSKISPALPALLSIPEASVLAVPGEKAEKPVHARLEALRKQAWSDKTQDPDSSSPVSRRSRFFSEGISPVSIENFLPEAPAEKLKLARTSLLFRAVPEGVLFQSPGLVGPV